MKKLNKIDRYLIFSITVLCIYTIVEQVLSMYAGYERSTLTTCFYGAFGGEILGCVVIKVFNIKKEEKLETEDDGIEMYEIPETKGGGEG